MFTTRCERCGVYVKSNSYEKFNVLLKNHVKTCKPKKGLAERLGRIWSGRVM